MATRKPDKGAPRKERWFTRLSKGQQILLVCAAIGAISVIMAAVLPPLIEQAREPARPTPAQQAEKYDGDNPKDECAPQPELATSLDTISIAHEQTGEPIATLEIRHSSECDTTWLRVTSQLDDVNVVMQLDRAAGDDLPAHHLDTSIDVNLTTPESAIVFSEQLYAPECSNLSVGLTITDHNGTVVGTYPLQKACRT